MRFLKVNPDLAIDAEKITALKVTGREDNAHVTAYMADGSVYNVSYHKNFDNARVSLMDLIERLEA
jgi:hypothetical protein